MSSSVAAFDKTIEKTNVWLNELEGILANEAPAIDEADLERVVAAVFSLLSSRLPHGERNQVRRALPAGVRELWAEPGL
jgi:hypothetical protein